MTNNAWPKGTSTTGLDPDQRMVIKVLHRLDMLEASVKDLQESKK